MLEEKAKIIKDIEPEFKGSPYSCRDIKTNEFLTFTTLKYLYIL